MELIAWPRADARIGRIPLESLLDQV